MPTPLIDNKKQKLKSRIQVGSKQVADLYLKRVGEFFEVVQAHITLRPLDTADISTVKT